MNGPTILAEQIGRGVITNVPQHDLTQHVAIFLSDGKILSDETFRLVKFSGSEQISGAFEFQLELHALLQLEPYDLADNVPNNFGFNDILTRSVTVGVNLPDAKEGDFARAIKGGSEAHLSLWNGIVTDFAMGVPGVYHLTMRPALWKLSLTNRYHIHHRLNIKDAIKSVLGDHDIVDSSSNIHLNSVSLSGISGKDNLAIVRTQDWLQAGESDLDFINRLIQKAYIYFYFEHHATSHRVVFANRATYPEVFEDGRKLRYAETSIEPLGLDQDDLVLDYRYSQTMTSTGISNVLARQHAAWEEDTVAQYDTYKTQTSGPLGDLPFQRFQICQYGGSDGEVNWDTQTCDTTRSTSSIVLQGSSTCPKMRPGYQFALDKAGNPETLPHQIRPTLGVGKFVLSQVQHNAELGGSYKNQFKATVANGQVAPFSLHDTQQGMVLATVIKHDNGTPPKDWRYYKKTAFDPESSPLTDTAAQQKTLRAKGVYVRFATAPSDSEPVWVKLAQHMLTVPELNVVVLVSRANDHGELPEIQSIVQNNGRKDVTPSGWTSSTAVGSNYSTNYGDSRSVRFGLNSPGNLPPAKTWVDDKYNEGNSEHPGWFSGVHLRDVSWSKGGSSNYSTAENGRTDVLGESISVGCNYRKDDAYESKGVSKVDHSWNESTGITSYSKSIISDTSTRDDTVGTSISTSKTDKSTRTDTVGTSVSTSVTGHSTRDETVGTSISTSKTDKSTRTDTVGTSISTSKTDKSTRTETVGTSKSTSKTGSSTRHDTVGTSVTTSITGASTQSSLTGASNSNSATGASNNNSAVGVSVDLSAVGSSDRLSATGAATSLSATGDSTSLSAVGAQTDLSTIGVQTQISSIGEATLVSSYGTGIEASNRAAVLAAETLGSHMSLISLIKVYL